MVLVGRLKLPYQDLFVLSNDEIECIVYGHEIDIRDKWELERNTTALMVSPYADKDFDIKKIMPFAWDEVEEVEFASKEDFAKAKEMLNIVKKSKEQRDGK